MTFPALRTAHRLEEGSSPVDIEALQQLVRDDQSFSLGVAGDADPLAVLLRSLLPVPVPVARVALVQQVTNELGKKCLNEGKKQRRKKKKKPQHVNKTMLEIKTRGGGGSQMIRRHEELRLHLHTDLIALWLWEGQR